MDPSRARMDYPDVVDFIIDAHGNQKRKYTGEPYWVHPVEVATIVRLVCDDEQVVAAAYLHDTLEDTNTSYEDIANKFGKKTADLVVEVTNVAVASDGNRAARKAIERDHLAKASPEGQTIKLADVISNVQSIAANDPNFARVYLVEKKELLDVLQTGNAELRQRAYQLITESTLVLDRQDDVTRPVAHGDRGR